MSVLRRMMMNGFNIDAIPSSRKIYYTASEKIIPKENSLGSKVLLNMYDSTTMNGVLVTANDITSIGDSAFKYCTSLISVNIPDSVTTIGEGAFYNCSSLTNITIPNSVTEIGYSSFQYCESLTSIIIPDSVATIGKNSFWKCNSLTSVNIPNSVVSIGEDSFGQCKNLKDVTIGNNVTKIDKIAFFWCESLTSVYCKPTTPPSLGTDVFNLNGSGRKIYVPTESVEAYKSATNWSVYASDIVGYEF